MSCLFCKIISKEIKSEFVYEDDHFIAIKDIEPIAPTHLLFIPKIHIASLNEVDLRGERILDGVFGSILNYARKENISDYRIVNNCGASSGQSVFHVHFHFLSGRNFLWPPG